MKKGLAVSMFALALLVENISGVSVLSLFEIATDASSQRLNDRKGGDTENDKCS